MKTEDVVEADFSTVLLYDRVLYVSPQVGKFRYITQLCVRACSQPSTDSADRLKPASFSTDLLHVCLRSSNE